MIILLDLNYTLVGNSEKKLQPFHRQIVAETYRQWLIDLIRHMHVIMITARPDKYQAPTLASIAAKTSWLPQESFFNDSFLPPPAFKKKVMVERILPRGEPPEKFLAIESNPKTRAMYAALGIRAIAVPETGQWTTLPA